MPDPNADRLHTQYAHYSDAYAIPRVLCYGGGRQTIAIIAMCHTGRIPWPDYIIHADTGMEVKTTMEYYHAHIAPLLNTAGVPFIIANQSLAAAGLYSTNGYPLMPIYTTTGGKMPTYCSGEWKTRVSQRHMRTLQLTRYDEWIGYGYEEQRRWQARRDQTNRGRTVRCPMVDAQMTTAQGLNLIKSIGLPPPHQSRCWSCPMQNNAQWRDLRDNHPEDFAKAIELERQLNEDTEHLRPTEFRLHHRLLPLAEAPIGDESPSRICSESHCMT